jgi:transposase-like protein
VRDGPPTWRGKKVRKNAPVPAAENRGRGRPTLLTPELGEPIALQLAGGARLADAAIACGLSPRTLRAWRRRAWSSRPEDRAYVELEQRLRAVLVDAPPAVPAPRDDEPWEEAASRLEANAAWWHELARER